MAPTSMLNGPVLVVDDDPEVLGAYELMLSANGLEVRVARNAREALARVEAEPIPVCLVDLHLGESNGIQLCVDLRAADPMVRCIIITAYPAFESAVSALKLGIVDYLSKAEAPSRILEKVKACLAARTEEQRSATLREEHRTPLLLACGCECAHFILETLTQHHPDYDLQVARDICRGAAAPDEAKVMLLCESCCGVHGDPQTTVRRVAEARPQSRILILNCTLTDEAQQELLPLGVRGFLPKGATAENLLDALEVVLRDHFWISRSLTARVLTSLLLPQREIPSTPLPLETPLSPRELEILRALSEGLSNLQIGDRLFISESTVKIHVHRIFRKLGVKSRTQALLKAMELRLL